MKSLRALPVLTAVGMTGALALVFFYAPLDAEQGFLQTIFYVHVPLAFVPMNFIAVRLSSSYVHPRVLGSTSNLPGSMALTFVVSLIAIGLLYVTLCRLELSAKHTRARLRALRARAEPDGGAILEEGAP